MRRVFDASRAEVPRVIWSYWHQGTTDLPSPIAACVKSAEVVNSAWDYRLLDANTVKNFLPPEDLVGLENLPHFLRADRIRMALLVRHGGVWADPTVFFWEPLDAWLPPVPRGGLFTFTLREPDRIEYWFLASHPGSSFLVELLRRHRRYFWFPRIHRPRGKWQKIQHFLERNLNQSHSNAVWWARFPLWLFPAYPYFIFCYLADRLLKSHSELASFWESSFFPDAASANTIFHKARSKEPISTSLVEQALDSQSFPVSKFSFRLGKPEFWQIAERMLIDRVGR